MEVLYTARFLRSFNKLSKGIESDVEYAVSRFEKNPKHKALELHKLKGRMQRYHAFSANYSHRVVVKMVKGTAYCKDVGDHSVYE